MSNQIIGLQGIESKEEVLVSRNLSIKEELDNLSKYEVVSRHSYFQLKYFLIGKEPTNQGKMWQCLRELKARKESLSSLELELEESKDRIELLDIKIQRIKKLIQSNSEVLDLKENTIKLRQTERKRKASIEGLNSLTEKKKWIEEECKFFLETFANIQKIEPLKEFDDLNSQKEYWGEKLAQKLNIKLLSNNQIDSDIIETIVSLPDDIPTKKQTLLTLNVRHQQMAQSLKSTMEKLESKKG